MAIELLHRKESVILTTIEIIGDLGIQGLSTKEIAKRQGISEGTLFRHFKTKNDIILAVLDYFSQYDKDIFATARQKGGTAQDSILFVIDSFATYYENYPAITVGSQLYGFLSFNPVLGEKVKEIVKMRNAFLTEIIAGGQACAELCGTKAEALADVIHGTFNAICLKWWLANQSFSLRTQAVATVKMVLDTFIVRKRRNSHAKSINR